MLPRAYIKKSSRSALNVPTQNTYTPLPQLKTENTAALTGITRKQMRINKVYHWLLICGVVLTIIACKFALINTAGRALPTWDQWDSECEIMLRPWLEGRLHWENIITPHVEHRIVTAKLTALGLLITNGQWDGFVETTFNATIHAFSALVLLLIGMRWINGHWLVGFGVLNVALFALPFSWENTLFGFQVPFYYVLLFSLLHILLTLKSDRFSWQWGCGLWAGALAVVSMASGFLAAAAVLATVGYQLLSKGRLTAQQIVTVAFTITLCIFGWWLKTDVPGHDFLKVSSAYKFLINILHLFAWPGTGIFPLSLLISIPTGIFIVRCLRQRKPDSADLLLFALVVWVVLQICAISYSRGGAGSVITSRYLDLVVVNVAIGWICIVREFTGRKRRIIAVSWMTIVLSGLTYESIKQWDMEIIPGMKRRDHQEENVRAYLRTGDAAHLRNKPFAEIPYPNAETLIDRLSHANVRSILPWTVRPSLPITANSPAPLSLPADFSSRPGSAPLAVSTWAKTEAHAFTWRSSRQPDSTLAVLRFQISGDLGRPGKQLSMTIKSDTGEKSVVPSSSPGLTWKTVNVIRPSGEWWIEVTDNDPIAWFAFTEPIELSRGSYFIGKLLKHNTIIAAIGILLIIAGAANDLKTLSFRIKPWESRLRIQLKSICSLKSNITSLSAISRSGPSTTDIKGKCGGVLSIIFAIFTGTLAMVIAMRLGLLHPMQGATPLIETGAAWLVGVPRNYGWYTISIVSILSLLFVPGIYLFQWWHRHQRSTSAIYFPIPGLIVLVLIGCLAWLQPDFGNICGALWLLLNLLMAAHLSYKCWTRDSLLPIKREELVPLSIYTAICISALAFAVLPRPVAQEFGGHSTAQARMIASPPDHGIPFRTAVYFYEGYNGRKHRTSYFGQDWSVASRGPIAPFAINALFRIFGIRPHPFAGTSLEAWPA